MNAYAARVYEDIKAKYPWQTEFLQSVAEVFESLGPVLDKEPKYEANKILERMIIPERIIQFQVPWIDDKGEIQVNVGYRVQFNSAIGPYKGCLRFHPSVNLSILKFLGFEQTFKNALTTLPMGGGKGGADFDPKGKSDREIMYFCQAFMRELYRHIGPNTDVPAGDIGVGAREVGYLIGQYKHLANTFTGVLTGTGLGWGGSLIRSEATGFGAVYFVEHMLALKNETLAGKRVSLSGYGNVAWGAALKATQLGAKVITISGSDGYVYVEDGLTYEMIDFMLEVREKRLGIKGFADKFPQVKFVEGKGKRPWEVPADIAMPCATQNELDGNDAAMLVKNGVQAVAEVSNMGSTPEAVACFQANGVVFAPGKAVNAGGVATSGLEMSQNAGHGYWTAEKVDARLHQIMTDIHASCVANGTQEDGTVNYVMGANIAGFRKVADAMIAQGL